jgi:hypothetical protein
MLRSIAASPNCLSATQRQGCYDAHQHLDCPRYHTRPVSHHAILATGERDAADLCREPGCLGVPTVRRPIIGGDQRVVRPQESLCKPCRSRDKAYQRAPLRVTAKLARQTTAVGQRRRIDKLLRSFPGIRRDHARSPRYRAPERLRLRIELSINYA